MTVVRINVGDADGMREGTKVVGRVVDCADGFKGPCVGVGVGGEVIVEGGEVDNEVGL